MATSPNFNWPEPDNTDLVKNGALAIRTAVDAIDTSLVDLKGGTTGQVLSKTSNTDMDFTWVAQDDSNAIQNAIVDAKGDLIAATANDTPARLAVSATNDMVLMSDSTAATGLAWSTTWTSFTPTWTATTTNPVIGNGTLLGKYIKIGKVVIAQYRLVAGSTTTFGSGNYRFSLPITADVIASSQGGLAGSLFMEDNGVANFQSTGVRLPLADRVEFLTSSTLPVSNTSPFTWANGDFFMGEIVYGVA